MLGLINPPLLSLRCCYSHDSQLRKWLSRQRQEWKKVYDSEQKEMSADEDDDGKKRNPKPSATMTRDKIMKLALIGVGSLQNGPARSMGNVNRGLKEWDVKYEELVAFKNEFGHCNVSRSAHKHTHGALGTSSTLWSMDVRVVVVPAK